jgi:hypothetical protein
MKKKIKQLKRVEYYQDVFKEFDYCNWDCINKKYNDKYIISLNDENDIDILRLIGYGVDVVLKNDDIINLVDKCDLDDFLNGLSFLKNNMKRYDDKNGLSFVKKYKAYDVENDDIWRRLIDNVFIDKKAEYEKAYQTYHQKIREMRYVDSKDRNYDLIRPNI